jgi:hypothetical protein
VPPLCRLSVDFGRAGKSGLCPLIGLGEGVGMVEVLLQEEHIERLYEPVGRIVLYWGFIDIAMTDIPLKMIQIRKTLGESHNLPVMFGARLKIVKKHLRNRSEFASVKDDGLRAIEGIRKAQTIRDMIIHGVAVAYDPAMDAIAFSRIDRLSSGQKKRIISSSPSHSFGRTWLPFKTLEETSGHCLAISQVLSSVLDRLNALL